MHEHNAVEIGHGGRVMEWRGGLLIRSSRFMIHLKLCRLLLFKGIEHLITRFHWKKQ